MAKKPSSKTPVKGASPKTGSGISVQAPQKPDSVPSLGKHVPLFLLLSGILALVALVIYINSVMNGYVLDDVMVLKDNTLVTLGVKAIPELFRTPHMHGYLIIPNDMYRPLSLVMFAIEYSLFGLSPGISHFINILVYIGCVLVFFAFIHRFFDRKKIIVAFVCALFFAVHPIHTEVVSNIKSRDELMCFLFAFLSLNFFLDYMEDKKGIIRLALGAVMMFLSYLSKETVVTFAAIVPFLFFFIKNQDRKKAIIITAVTLAVTVIYIWIRAVILKEYNANQPTPVEFIDNALAGEPSAIIKFGTEVLIMGYYLRMMFVPYPLISNYSYNKIPFVGLGDIWVITTLAAYAFLVYLALSKFFKDKKNPWTFGVLFYLATISLFSNFPFLMGAEIAERFTFFATAGTCILMALAFEQWILKGEGNDLESLKKTLPLTVLCLICIPFSGLTFMRNFDWKSNAVLYRADLAKSPEDSRLNYYLGTAMAEGVYDSETDTLKKHEIDKESIEHLRKSLSIYNEYTEANAEIGRVFYRERMYDSAEKHDKKALEINPNHVTGNNNLGSVYLTAGRYAEAISLFRKTVTLDPKYSYAYFNMARAYMQLKNYDSAIINFRISLDFNPGNLDAQQECGMAWYFKQNWDSAAKYFKAALSLNPNDANAVNNLGAIYLNNKRYPEAIGYFQKALAINPSYINAASNLARAYFFSAQYPKAIETIVGNLKIAPKFYNDVPYIALSYQKMGRMDSARKYEAIAKQIYSNFKLE